VLRGGLNDTIGLRRVVVMGVALRRVGVKGFRVRLVRLRCALGLRQIGFVTVREVRMLVRVIVVMMSVKRVAMSPMVMPGGLRL